MTYNLRVGGLGGIRTLSIESKNKMSASLKESYKHRTPESFFNFKEAMRQVRASSKYKEKMKKKQL